jgi:hypothetical protein
VVLLKVVPVVGSVTTESLVAMYEDKVLPLPVAAHSSKRMIEVHEIWVRIGYVVMTVHSAASFPAEQH